MRYQIVMLQPETSRTEGIASPIHAIISLTVRGLLWPGVAFRRWRRAKRRRQNFARLRKLVRGYATRR